MGRLWGRGPAGGKRAGCRYGSWRPERSSASGARSQAHLGGGGGFCCGGGSASWAAAGGGVPPPGNTTTTTSGLLNDGELLYEEIWGSQLSGSL
jgi:hypothetical protein